VTVKMERTCYQELTVGKTQVNVTITFVRDDEGRREFLELWDDFLLATLLERRVSVRQPNAS
jgi:hypothetical protein